jgi:hypothetical protein
MQEKLLVRVQFFFVLIRLARKRQDKDAVVMNVVYYGQKTNKGAHNFLV